MNSFWRAMLVWFGAGFVYYAAKSILWAAAAWCLLMLLDGAVQEIKDSLEKLRKVIAATRDVQ